MGNKQEKDDRWKEILFYQTNLGDVNEFCRELMLFNDKINELRKAFVEAERSLVLYLCLNELEEEIGKDFRMTIQDVTLSIFYSFSSFFKGDFKRMLNVKFFDEPPYFEINIHYLDPILKDVWMAYQKFLEVL